MTRSDFHRSTILRGDLFSFQPDTGETWREESLFEQVDAPNDDTARLLPTDDRGLELPTETAHEYSHNCHPFAQMPREPADPGFADLFGSLG